LPRILVIDDDPYVRSLLRRILELEGHEVAEAADGDAGAALFRSAPADLVITDIIMPSGDGALTIRQLRRDFPGLKVIAVSGGGEIAGADTCLNVAARAGAQRTLSKPFKKDELLEAVTDVLGL
jgi:CheY-like chemotaxis protein